MYDNVQSDRENIGKVKHSTNDMATVKFLIKGKNNPTNMYCRFCNTKAIDITTTINFFINPAHWDYKGQRIKNVVAVKNRDVLNKKLQLLKIHIIDEFNLCFMDGEIIDKTWLTNTINKFYKRPTQEVKNRNLPHTIYLSNFANWWIMNESPKWTTQGNISKRALLAYKIFTKHLKLFEGSNKVRLKDISNEVINTFVVYLAEDDYSCRYIGKLVNTYKFFCFRAEELNFNINNGFKKRVVLPKVKEIKEPYLNPEEIDKLFSHDFGENESLDNVRDNLIIAVWTGLRISDFMSRLNVSNFIDDFIEITTQKTKTPVSIPIHDQIKEILIKRNGQLPRKITDDKFNKDVKKVCKEVGINNKMKGKLFDNTKKRKITGVYEKYKLVSSHIGRRSFATNHFGKIANQTLMKICGWSSEPTMMNYIKKSDRSYAVELQEYWKKTI